MFRPVKVVITSFKGLLKWNSIYLSCFIGESLGCEIAFGKVFSETIYLIFKMILFFH